MSNIKLPEADADGWMIWSGGENPVPRQRVSVRLRDGAETDPEPSNMVFWRHQNRSFDVIAFRLAPTAPVEASGSERDDEPTEPEMQRAEVVSALLRYSFEGGAACDVADEIIGLLRPQPSGETREAVARELIRQHYGDRGYSDLGIANIIDGDIEGWLPKADAIFALLSARPLALGGQHSGGEWRCEDCGAQADEWFDCCKNPARAEAQDEGAALSDEDHAIIRRCVERQPKLYVRGQHEGYYIHSDIAALIDMIGRAHPSPTPAADADRVRELEAEVTHLRDALLGIAESDHYRRYPKQHEDGGVRGQSGLRAVRALTGQHGSYINDDEVRRLDAEKRDALKSTAAKEGGE